MVATDRVMEKCRESKDVRAVAAEVTMRVAEEELFNGKRSIKSAFVLDRKVGRVDVGV